MSTFLTEDDASRFWSASPLLAEVRELPAGLSLDERRVAVDQLLNLLRHYYVHLPLKRSSLGIDPVQEVLLLQDELAYLATDLDFFRRLIGIVRTLRDRHIMLRLPQPYSSMVALLPFTAESVADETGRRLIVTKILAGVAPAEFSPGTEITHWNGVPIRRFVESLSLVSDGANPFARIALTLRSLTIRPLGYGLPPDEDWVVLNFTGRGGAGSIAFPWRVYFPQGSSATNVANDAPLGGAAVLEGLDRPTLVVNGTWLDIFSRRQSAAQRAGAAGVWQHHVLSRTVTTSTGQWGYLRFHSFEAADSAAFLIHVAAELQQLPEKGVILDVRANPGGTIPSGEAIAQLFTSRTIATEPVSFRNTQATRQLGQHPSLLRWRRSLDMQLDTGDTFSQGFPLTSEATHLRGVYPGPVALIVDALSYSTTDFLAATLQDNNLATIIGVDPVTGAGGANVWTHSTLGNLVAEAGGWGFEPLPRGMELSVPVRRSVRVGANAGLPVEGLGVFADHQYAMTRDDVLSDNRDLIEFAGRVLAHQQR